MEIKISKRKLKSYKNAELVCQELRYQLSNYQNWDGETLSKFLIDWMAVTGSKIKYTRPNKPKK